MTFTPSSYVVQLHELVSDGVGLCHVLVDPGEEPPLPVRQEEKLAHDDRAAHRCIACRLATPAITEVKSCARSVIPSESMPP